MIRKTGWFAVTMILLLGGCARRNGRVVAEQIKNLPAFASGSGLQRCGDRYLAVGDDAPRLVWLSATGHLQGTLTLPRTDSTRHRLPKWSKPDYECLALQSDSTVVYAFGSGSLHPYRDSILVIPVNNPASLHTRPAAPLYAQLLARAGRGRSLNLEGAAFLHGRLYVLDRLNNLVFSLPEADFVAYVQRGVPVNPGRISVSAIQLPVYKGIRAGFSGLTVLPGPSPRLLFCASLEATGNALADGAILGSYAGLLQVKDTSVTLLAVAPVEDGAGKRITDKLEAVEVEWAGKKELRIIALADNDDGSSRWLRLHWRGIVP